MSVATGRQCATLAEKLRYVSLRLEHARSGTQKGNRPTVELARDQYILCRWSSGSFKDGEPDPKKYPGKGYVVQTNVTGLETGEVVLMVQLNDSSYWRQSIQSADMNRKKVQKYVYLVPQEGITGARIHTVFQVGDDRQAVQHLQTLAGTALPGPPQYLQPSYPYVGSQAYNHLQRHGPNPAGENSGYQPPSLANPPASESNANPLPGVSYLNPRYITPYNSVRQMQQQRR